MKEKGFAIIFIILGLAAVGTIVGGGFYFYHQQNEKKGRQEALQPSVTERTNLYLPTPTQLPFPSPTPKPQDTFTFPDELHYAPKPDWNVVTAKDGSSKFDFPESFKLYATSFDDKVECKPLTEEDIRRRQNLTVEDFVTSIQVYGFRLNGQSLEDAVNNPRKTRLNGLDIIYGGSITEKAVGNPPVSPIGEKKLTSNGRQAIYHLHEWPVGKPFGPLYRHRIYVQKGNNFIVLTMFVTEPFHQKRFDEIVAVLSSLR